MLSFGKVDRQRSTHVHAVLSSEAKSLQVETLLVLAHTDSHFIFSLKSYFKFVLSYYSELF